MRKKAKRKINKKAIILIVLILVIAITTIMAFTLKKDKKEENKEFYGLWTIDGYTDYEFSENNKGKLIIPSKEYVFTYTIEENKICIDFENETSIDRCYEYEFKDECLILKRDDGLEHKFTRK